MTRTIANDARSGSSRRRHVLGGLAILLIAGAALFRFWFPWMDPNAANELYAACWRIGSIFAVWWIGYNQLARLPVWIWFALPAGLLVLMSRPGLLAPLIRVSFYLIPVYVLLALLMPRKPRPKR